MIAVCLLALSGCGGDSSNSSDAQALIDDNTPTVSGPTPTGGTVSVLTGLTDLGDLLEPDGDHWYFTKPAAINDNGIIVGTSNNGIPNRAAFMWDPTTELMTFLGIHSEFGRPYFDYYIQKIVNPIESDEGFIYSEAVDVNSSGDIVGNSITTDGNKRAFIRKDGEFIDLPPILDTFDGDFDFEIRSFSEVIDINDKGEVVLTAEDKTGRHAYYWDGDVLNVTTITLPRDDETTFEVTVPLYRHLARITGDDAAPVAINESGHVAINSGGTAIYHDLNWDVDVFEVLNHLPGATRTVAVDINDSVYTNNDDIPDGHIIGNSGNGSLDINDDDSVRGFFWDGGAMYPVDHLGGGTSVTTDLNNNDQVVGAATTASGTHHAFLWTLDPATEKGVMRDLGTLGGDNSYATAINEAGQITGWSETGDFYSEHDVVVAVRHAFLWNAGVMYDLGTHNDFYDYLFVPSFPFSAGVAINAAGEVTGSSITINNHHRGFYLAPALP
jgi:probable HAF family extracellular repeat protein